MNNVSKAVRLLTPEERRSALLLLPLICLRAFADMVGVALIFPFLNILGNPEIITTNKYLAWAYNAGGFSGPNGFVVFIGVAFIAILIATAALKIATVYTVNYWLELRAHSISSRLLNSYLRRPYEFMLSRHSSTLVTNMLSEVPRIIVEVYKPLSDATVAAVTLLFLVGMLLVVDPIVTILVMAVLGGLYVALFWVIRGLAARIGKTLVDSNRNRYRIAWEALAGGKQVRLLNRERSLIESYEEPSLTMATNAAKSRLLRQSPRYVVEVIAIGGTILLVLSLLGRSGGVGSSSMTDALPTLGLFVLAGYRMMPALQNGYLSVVSLKVGKAALDALLEDLDGVEGLPELPRGRIEPLRFQQSIELRNVTYYYPGTDTPGLKDINLTIPAGSSVGIIGPTGAGKTTLMDMLLGLIEPSKGEFLVDGQPLDHAKIRAWRANVGYVPQDIFLSDASIAQNIAFGAPPSERDFDRVREAARMAQIDGFISNELSEGYETLVGERGVRLSGGQRQRISIARALYTEPQVIAFDEATSALDNSTESLVMEEISKLAGSRTLIMVAHRLSTVRNCDALITLEAGEVVKVGTYADVASQAEVLPLAVNGRH
ncbi:ABC transporter ATP-binding protein [Poseidonocella sp. HB161398]|uniref:ABC transporter ATP-binding protein n=1 Tax=Poseidonocella sp. HB161398 TaxID=2320855 RepID=UPI001486C3DE|nr:ABC transporter ATP-binding protein [Poseidonocella sp. HB161398]